MIRHQRIGEREKQIQIFSVGFHDTFLAAAKYGSRTREKRRAGAAKKRASIKRIVFGTW